MSDSFTPVIIIEGFLGLGVVLWLYMSHQREMKRIRQDKADKAKAAAQSSGLPAGAAVAGSKGDPKTPSEGV